MREIPEIRDLGIKPYGACPNERQLRHLRRFSKKAFFHFGVNTFTDLEWGEGKEREELFAPTALDTRQWARAAAQAGFSLGIITAKHHDGFCLWQSRHTEHCMKNSPYKNGQGDVVRKFADACREYGLGVGVYVSPWDRNAPFWGTDKYSEYYAAQLTELMTEYGPIDEVWWDGAGSAETPYDWALWHRIIRENQPNAAIFGSMGATEFVDFRWVGNESGYAGRTHYACIDPEYLIHETPAELNRGSVCGADWEKNGLRYIPAEVDVSVRPGWFYHADQDGEVKSVKRLTDIWFDSVGSNAMMLLNFPPDRRGLVCDRDAENALLSDRIIASAFAVNLAFGAVISADNTLCPGAEAENLLQPYEGCYYAASEKRAEITLRLPRKTDFNAYSLEEVIELGERVTGHALYARSDGEDWRLICENTSVGNLRAEHFEITAAEEVRLIIEGVAPPVLRSFGLHLLPDSEMGEERNVNGSFDLLKRSTARTEVSEDKRALFVELGGIYPFNNIRMNCDGVWRAEIYAFNGQSYELIRIERLPARECEIALKEPINGCYRIKIVLDKPLADKLSPEIYLL